MSAEGAPPALHLSPPFLVRTMPVSPVAMDNNTLSDLVNENLMRAKEYHCNSGDLMGGLGLVVQAALAFLAFTSLIGLYEILDVM